jgi:hypothetical protein
MYTPEECPPPRGVKLLLLTKGGVCIIGTWKDGDFDEWFPLPSRSRYSTKNEYSLDSKY